MIMLVVCWHPWVDLGRSIGFCIRAGVAGDPSGGKGFRDLEEGKAESRIRQSLGTGTSAVALKENRR